MNTSKYLAAGFLMLACLAPVAWAQPGPAVVNGIKYEDANADGDLADGDPVAGVTIFLISGDGQFLIDSAVTDGAGYYEFSILEPADYLVCEVVPAGWFQSAPGNSDCGAVPGGVGDGGYAISVELGVTYPGNDFGNWTPGTIDGTKFEDLNGNGVWELGEPVIPGVEICAGDVCALTDANGIYVLTLPPGQHTVCETAIPDWTQSSPSNDNCAAVTGAHPGGHIDDLSSGELEPQRDFGNFVTGSAHPFKFEDLNSDGILDPGEPPMPGVEFQLIGADGKGNQVGPLSANSDSDGYAWFLNIPPGNYLVTEIVPPASLPSTHTNVFLQVQSRWELVHEDGAARLPNGSPRVEVNVGTDLIFGNYQKLSITACKMVDKDGKSWTDDLELRPGWIVQLGTTDGVILDEQITGTDGCYTWNELGPLQGSGNYVIYEELPAGWNAWTPTSYDCGPMVSGDSCEFTFVNALPVPIPTLDKWGIILMILMLTGLGWQSVRRIGRSRKLS